jgi:hypothetical protein
VIIRAAVVPHPPLLVPELVTGAAAETEPIRLACVTAARRLAQVADDWVAVGADPDGTRWIEPNTVGGFAGYGVDVRVALSDSTPSDFADSTHDETFVPLPALIAGWLRAEAGARSVRVRLVGERSSAAEARDAGAALAAELAGPHPYGLLVLGDGSNRHTDRAPARPDDRAADFDGAVRKALATGDPAALLDIDQDLADELNVVARAAWQTLAGAALAVGAPWRAELLYSDAPFGVAYHVAVWDPPANSID